MTTDIAPIDSNDTDDGALLRAAALAWNWPDRISEIAAAHGVDISTIAAVLGDPKGIAAASRELERLRRSGELLKVAALPVLERFLARADAAMDDESVSPATLTRVADTTMRLSGIVEERAAKLRQEASERPNFVNLIISNPGDPEPPPEKPGEMRLVIVAPDSAGLREGNVVGGEVIDGE